MNFLPIINHNSHFNKAEEKAVVNVADLSDDELIALKSKLASDDSLYFAVCDTIADRDIIDF